MTDALDPVRCDGALTAVFALLGKRWTGVILGSLMDRPARFAEMASAIPGITDAMLSTRLVELQKTGLVKREVLPGPPIASMYRLTDEGLALRPALTALATWAETHMLGAPASKRGKRRVSSAAAASRRRGGRQDAHQISAERR